MRSIQLFKLWNKVEKMNKNFQFILFVLFTISFENLFACDSDCNQGKEKYIEIN